MSLYDFMDEMATTTAKMPSGEQKVFDMELSLVVFFYAKSSVYTEVSILCLLVRRTGSFPLPMQKRGVAWRTTSESS